MSRIKKFKITLKAQKKLKFILYFSSFFLLTYLCIPKLLNFSPESIKENLKNDNNININNISKVNYKIFPTPRLSIPNSDFTIGEDVLEVSNSDIEIILNISKILNFKEINYKKLIINKGTSKINLNNINLLLSITNKNKKKLTFSENNIIFFRKEKVFFEIKNALIKMNQYKIKKNLILNGDFLNNKIFIELNSTLQNKNNLIIKIPELDIATRIFFKKNNSVEASGSFNLEVFNNLLKFNFIKGNNIKITDGFIRSKLVNASLEGKIAVKPNFFSKIDFETSNLNMEKLFPVIQKAFFLDNTNNLPLIKKINGVFNFKSNLEGKIINKNGELSFEDFKVGKNKPLFFNAKIIEFGKKGKVQFSLVKTIQNKRDSPKKIEIKGFLIPSNSKVIFEKLMIDGKELPNKKIKDFENKFSDNVIQNSLVNIFQKNKIDKYFKNLF